MAEVTLNISSKSNQPPNQSGWLNVSMNYNSQNTFTLSNFTTETNPPYSDPEGDPLESIKITSLPVYGTFELSSTPVTLNQEISSNDLSLGNLTYTSDNNSNGYSDSFEFTVSDTGSSTFRAESNLVAINVNGLVNSPPSNVGALTLSLDNRSTHVFTTANFTTETTPVYSDPEGDSADLLKITSLPVNGTLYLSGTAIDVTGSNISFSEDISAGNLTYISDQDTDDSYSDSFNFSIADSGSNSFTSGGSMTLNVAEFINQPPVTSDNTINDDEGDVYTFAMSDFPSSDPEMDAIVAVRFPTLPGAGNIKLNGVNVTVNQEISSTDVDSNLLTYTQGPNAGGTQVQFTFQVKDSNGNWSN